jgi:uncharacterized protein
MKLLLNNPDQSHLIHSCEKRENGYQIRIGDAIYYESIILTPEKLQMWTVSQVSDLKDEDFVRFADLGVEVVILGTGDKLVFPHPAIMQPLMKQGVGVEVMDTAAACRTYNILLSDGRQAAAGLIL